jgi:type II secretory pathway component PulC
MARAIKARSDEPEVDLFAEKVMATQTAEVKNMQQMLKEMNAPPVKDEPSMDGMDMGGDHHGG